MKHFNLRRNASGILVILMMLINANIFAQSVIVTGIVTDESGSALPGVTIVEKGTTNGTTTDFDGAYSVNVSNANATLVVSFIGMKTMEIGVAGKKSVNITMVSESVGLEDVIVTGYASMRKADLTGAVEVVKMDAVSDISLSTGSPAAALQGRVPGLYIEKSGSPSGRNNRILIRGENTLGNNDPLYIIDGVPTKRPQVFQSLSPSSIVSIQVLKDASASSIYGSRASNGVIIVTTKNGSGQKGKVNVEVNSSFSVQSEKPVRFKMANAVERGRALWQASVNDHVDPSSGYGEIYNFDWNHDLNNPVLNSVTTQPYVGGNTNVPSADTDWQNETYQAGYVTNNEVTVSGGDEKSSVLMNIGYLKNTGMMKFTNYDRLSARINARTSLLNNKLRLGMNTSIASSNERNECRDLGSAPTPGLAVILPPTLPVYTSTGDYAGPIGSGYSDRNNPIFMQYINRFDNLNRSYMFGNVYAEFEPIKNLTFRTNIGIDYSMVNSKDIEPSFENGFIARSMNSLSIYNSNFTSLTWSNTLNYKFNADLHNFSILLGTEAISDNFRDYTGYKEGFSVQTEDFFVLSAGTRNGNSYGTASGSRLLSQFGKIDYDYDRRYLASVTVRRDGSSRFGIDNRYGVFPAVTLGWRLSEEEFLKYNEKVSNLKLRMGAGRVGNQDVGEFASLALFEPRYGATANQIGSIFHNDFFDQFWNVGTAYALNGANSGYLSSGFVSVQAANPALKWETTDELNVGVDFGLFDDQLIGSFDYFARKTSDILIQPPVASALGEGQKQFLNGATQVNNGWEFALNYRKKVDNDLTFEIGTTFSHFADKITELPEEVRTAYPGNAEKTIIGHSSRSIFGYVTDGIFQTDAEVLAHASQVGAAPGRIRYKDLNSDGKIDALDQDFLGTTLPALEYGLHLNINYKKLDFALFGSGVAGKTGYDVYANFNNFVRSRENIGPGVFNAWTPSNTNTTVPALSLSDNNNEIRSSDYYNVDASYFKFRNAQIGYDLTSVGTKKAGIEKLRVFVSSDNFLWFKSSKFQGPDPERIDYNTIPNPTTVSFGLNVVM